MINDKASWSSFSGSLAKVENNKSSTPSIRGERYFGPSKMSFKNLILHSLSIISVFKIIVLLRSILFLAIYMFLINDKLTIITLIPVVLIIVLIFLVLSISKRENLIEINNSFLNILKIDTIK